MHILDHDLQLLNWINANYPSFTKIPFQNDEGDPLVGWYRVESWRGDATYPAVELKVLNQHLKFIFDETPYNYGLLSNDNCFMDNGTFTLRTLTTRFSNNQTENP